MDSFPAHFTVDAILEKRIKKEAADLRARIYHAIFDEELKTFKITELHYNPKSFYIVAYELRKMPNSDFMIERGEHSIQVALKK